LIDSGSITLYAVWDPEMYTITWKNSDGSIIKTGDYAYGTTPKL
jgi:hypothetical protein